MNKLTFTRENERKRTKKQRAFIPTKARINDEPSLPGGYRDRPENHVELVPFRMRKCLWKDREQLHPLPEIHSQLALSRAHLPFYAMRLSTFCRNARETDEWQPADIGLLIRANFLEAYATLDCKCIARCMMPIYFSGFKCFPLMGKSGWNERARGGSTKTGGSVRVRKLKIAAREAMVARKKRRSSCVAAKRSKCTESASSKEEAIIDNDRGIREKKEGARAVIEMVSAHLLRTHL